MNRLKQLRTSRGLSLDDLAESLSHLVTKQSLSKYERGESAPSPSVATRLAEFFEVQPALLWSAPQNEIEFIAYRQSTLAERAAEQLQASVSIEFEQRIDLQERCLGGVRVDLPVHYYEVRNEDDAERAAMLLRAKWLLGIDPINDVTALLEDHLIHVIEQPGNGFDGLSALASRCGYGRIAAAVISRDSAPGDRQRFNLIHELAHLVLLVIDGVDIEKMANRFAGAFLVPKSVLLRELGTSRTNLSVPELVVLKGYFKVSIQCLVVRAFQVGIISKPTYSSTFVLIKELGWREVEPAPIAREKSTWKRRVALRGYAEGMISREEAEKLSGESLPVGVESGQLRRKDFLRLTAAERAQVLQRQAEELSDYYKQSSDWESFD